MAVVGPLLRSFMLVLEGLQDRDLRELPQPVYPVSLTFADTGPPTIQVTVEVIGDAEPASAINGLIELGFHPGSSVAPETRSASGSIRIDRLPELDNQDERAYVEAAHVVRPELDVSVSEAMNLAAHGGSAGGWTGAGVIVGIVDQGVDVTHPSLCRADGTTRILALWDQSANGVTSNPASHTYGNEWTSGDIDHHLTMGVAFPSTDNTGHGTAVAGIVAGNGLAPPRHTYVGVAPEADLVVVKLGTQQHSFAATDHVVDAIDYVRATAAGYEQRAVVNVSQGAQIGSHDQHDQIERDLAKRFGSDPDCIVVTSAGNTGMECQHARALVSDGAFVDFVIEVPPYGGPSVVADIWYDLSDQYDVEVIDTSANSSGPINGTSFARGQLQDLWTVAGTPNKASTFASRIVVSLLTVSGTGNVRDGWWTIRVYGKHTPSGRPIDVWLERGWEQPRFRSFVDRTCTVTAPAACPGVIAVSGYDLSPTLGTFDHESGLAPDRRGNGLTMIAAPGRPVTAPTAAGHSVALHHPVCGTSFAAAHVSGAIALMLQAAPSLSRNDVLECLTAQARLDGDTAAGPAEGWGAGKLDIAGALACAIAKHTITIEEEEE
jgi:subtilisin family serine protease